MARKILLLFLSLAALMLIQYYYTRSQIGREISHTLWGLNLLYYSKFLAQLPGEAQRDVENELHAGLDELRAAAPTLSPRTGFYDHEVVVRVSEVSPETEIHYSLDGSIPTREHPRLRGTLVIRKTGVVRVKAFEEDLLPSATVTVTYIIDYQGRMPVVSLVLDPVYLYNKRAGIYRNPFELGRAWERPADFAILSQSPGKLLQTELRLRIHGGRSRGQIRKSFRLYLAPADGDLRSWFGPAAKTVSPDQGEWVLRHVPLAFLHRDRLASTVARQIGLPVSSMVPVIVYVNGELWGVYDLMERVNPEFIAGKMPIEEVTLLRGQLAKPRVAVGDDKAWRELYDFVFSGDFTDPENYRRISRQFDLDNLIDFWILQIFIADDDRPDSNMDIFRTADDAPWRFLVWDSDSGFNYMGAYTEHDTFAWHARDRLRPDLKPYGSPDVLWAVESAALFRQLMTNAAFRLKFGKRFEQLLSTTLSTPTLLATFDELLATYVEVQDIESRHFPTDPPAVVATRPEEQIEMIREFIIKRPAVVKRLLRQYVPEL